MGFLYVTHFLAIFFSCVTYIVLSDAVFPTDLNIVIQFVNFSYVYT